MLSLTKRQELIQLPVRYSGFRVNLFNDINKWRVIINLYFILIIRMEINEIQHKNKYKIEFRSLDLIEATPAHDVVSHQT